MKKSTECALSTMNYIFLREVFNKNSDEESEIRVILFEELNLFLGNLSSEEWTLEFKELVKIELDEGGYLEDSNLTMDMIENLFNETIKNICYEEDLNLASKYMDIVREIKFNY